MKNFVAGARRQLTSPRSIAVLAGVYVTMFVVNLAEPFVSGRAVAGYGFLVTFTAGFHAIRYAHSRQPLSGRRFVAACVLVAVAATAVSYAADAFTDDQRSVAELISPTVPMWHR